MLYFVENIIDKSVYYLKKDSEVLVGRKDCDLLIQNDQSISKKHAIFQIKHDSVTIEDLNSRYKSYHNENELTPNVKVILQNNDTIKFGVFDTVYRFCQQEVITCGTNLKSVDIITLKEKLTIIGGEYINTWESRCTHLTVKYLSATIKVLHAVLDKKPIIDISFWDKCTENISKNLPFPKWQDYTNVPVHDPLLASIKLKYTERASLFRGKIFIFPNENNKLQMEDVIKKGGGACISWENNRRSLSQIVNSDEQYVVVQIPKTEETLSFKELIQSIRRKGKRTILLHEIALAILTGSCEKDCNPDFDRAGAVFSGSQTGVPIQKNVLALETQTEYFKFSQATPNTVPKKDIPDTLETSLDSSLPSRTEKNTKNIGRTFKERFESSMAKRKSSNALDEVRKKQKTETAPVVRKTNLPAVTEVLESNCPSTISSNKRKINESPVTTNKIKRSKTNPFAFLCIDPKSDASLQRTTTVKTEAVKKEARVQKINPFASINNISSTSKAPDITHNESSNFSNSSRILSSTRNNFETPVEIKNRCPKTSSNDSNIPWLSKNDIVPQEIEHLDPQLKRFAELFKNKVNIVKDNSLLRTRVIVDENDNGDTSCKPKNFKKFKKVQPRYPQTTILRCD